MTQNIERVLERGQRLEDLMDKTTDLEANVRTYATVLEPNVYTYATDLEANVCSYATDLVSRRLTDLCIVLQAATFKKTH